MQNLRLRAAWSCASCLRHGHRSLLGPTGVSIAVGIAYFVAARFGLALLTAPDGVAVFWPAAGISTGALIALGPGARTAVVMGTIGATIAANLMGDRTIAATVSFALCNAAEAVIAAWLIHRNTSVAFNLDALRRVLGLFMAAVIASALSGIGGTLGFVLLQGSSAPFLTTWSNWFVADALGIVTVAPLVIGLVAVVREPLSQRELMEGLAALIVLTAVSAIGFASPTQYWVTILPPALLVPLLLWPAARCRPVFAAAAVAIIATTMVWTITFGVGRLGDPSIPLGSRVRAAQGALLAIELGTLVLAAVFAEQRRYEAALRQSEARLREALTAGQVMAFEWDPHTRHSQRSANAPQILGFVPQDGLSASSFLAQVHVDDRANLKARMRSVCPQSPSYAARFRFKRPDGQEVWLEESATGEFDAAGRLRRIKGLARDITQRKHAEETLQESEQQFRDLLGALPAAIYVTDASGHITYCNQGAVDLWGVNPRLGLDKWCDFARFYHADGTPMLLRHCPTQIALQEGRVVRGCEALMERRDGTRIYILPNPTPLRDAAGAIVGVVNMTLDISERKGAELALAERDLQLALAGKAARVGSFAYDTSTELMQISQGYTVLHGLPEGTTEIPRSRWRAGVHPEDLPRLDAHRDRVWRERRRESNVEYRIVHVDGEMRWIEARSFSSYDHHGRPQRVVGVNIDITERKRAEEHQRVLVAELDHRVKNVLATVSAIISRTQEASPLAADFATALDGRIRSMSSTHELLSQGRWRGIQLLELVQRELAPFVSSDNAEIEGPDAVLSAEAAQIMAMVLHELVTNAAKYGALSTQSGRVRVGWRWRTNGAPLARLVVEWQEIGGPAVPVCKQSGYGTSVIRELLPYELGGKVDLVFAADGVRCKLEIPAEWVGGGQPYPRIAALAT
ncbi:MAG TPA: PAS domain S-box protein [Hyphomicrobiaceae bacterium]|nr:PAS domain S-box protein [Hyphomicrobiaceae bacterium]